MKCWSREREFNNENALGKKVFPFPPLFIPLLIPAVLGKIGENGIRVYGPSSARDSLLGRNFDLSYHFQSFVILEAWLDQTQRIKPSVARVHIIETQK